MRPRAFSVATQPFLYFLVVVFATVTSFAAESDQLPANILAGMGKPLHVNNAGGLHG